MTGTIWEIPRTNRKFSAVHLGVALLIGAVVGGAATFTLGAGLPTARVTAPAAEAAPRATVAAGDVHAAATEQYAGWYLRSPIGARAWAAETEQYTREWYERAANLAGSTTATEQYYSYYLGDGRDD